MKRMRLCQYNINNGGKYEDDWDFPVFSYEVLTREEFKEVVEKAHTHLLETMEEKWICASDIAEAIIDTDDRFFTSAIHLTAEVDSWKLKSPWEKKFKGVY